MKENHSQSHIKNPVRSHDKTHISDHHGKIHHHTVALVGNPNCGKTTIFNNLTGSRQHVGNYPGVTVEKREGVRRFHDAQLHIIDLPGIYSLTAYSEEEKVARRFIIEDSPDIVVDVLDASNLERNLYLAVQILELERPTVFALNMIDVADARDIKIDDNALSTILNIPVVRTVGSRSRGMDALLHALDDVIHHGNSENFRVDYGKDIEETLATLAGRLAAANREMKFPVRWLAIKLLENDQEIVELVKKMPSGDDIAAEAAAARRELEAKNDEDAEMSIAEFRYRFVGELLKKAVTAYDKDNLTYSDKIDEVLTNRVYGLPIFLGFMWLLFNMVFTLGEYPQGWLEDGFGALGELVGQYLPEGELNSLVVDGIIGGVGGVLVFLPNILLLFFGIALLEGTGYMARVAFIMDRVMRSVGLHGKSFIPLLLGFGCNVPAIMGTRTLDNPRDRLVTILVSPLMSCSARLPVYTLLISAFFAETIAGTVLFSIYLIGIVLAIIMARIFRSVLFRGEVEPFVMELPPYHMPTLKNIVLHMWERSVLYLKKAGTIILAVSVLMWFLTSYPQPGDFNGSADSGVAVESAGERLSQSYAGRIGHFVEPVIKPLGFDWKIGVSLFAGVAAKEVLVSTLGTIYSVGDDEDSTSLRQSLANDPVFSPLTAYTLMIFVLMYAPCLATLVIIWRETGSVKWASFTFLYATVLAWGLAFLVFQLGNTLRIGV